jgi:hypothetical protein
VKIGRIQTKKKNAKATNTEVVPVVVDKPVEPPQSLDTYKEHYPLLLHYSYAAIVEGFSNKRGSRRIPKNESGGNHQKIQD